MDEAELTRRAAEPHAIRPAPRRGYAKLFHDTVTQADRGCDFDFLIGGKTEEFSRIGEAAIVVRWWRDSPSNR